MIKIKRLYGLNEKYFDIIDSEEKAYWLGLLYADGCVYSKDKRYYIVLELKYDDKEHIKKFMKAIEAEHPIYETIKNGKKYVSVRIGSKYMFNSLCNLGCIPNKTLTLEFPDEGKVSKELIRHFMRGYFDGDGCLSLSNGFRKRPELKNPSKKKYPYKLWFFKVLGTKEFLEQYAVELGVKCNKLHCNAVGKNNYNLKYGGAPKVHKWASFLYKDSSIYLNRKYNIYEQISEQVELKNKQQQKSI